MEDKLCCSVDPTYHLMGENKRTGSYAVDFGAYMNDLAREIGAMPDLLQWLWKSPTVAVGYALGQSYSTYFRLQGPFMHKDCQVIAETELWEPVRSRPLVTNVLFLSIICLFGVVNSVCWVLEMVFMKQF